MSNKNEIIELETPEFRVDYCYVFDRPKPRTDKPNQLQKYGISAIFDPAYTDFTPMNNAIQSLIQLWYPNGDMPETFKIPLRDGTRNKPKEPAYHGMYFASMKSDYEIPVVDQNAKIITKLGNGEKIFYNGCYAKALVQFRLFDVEGSKGIRIICKCAQKTRDGDVILHSVDPTTIFTPIPGAGQTIQQPVQVPGNTVPVDPYNPNNPAPANPYNPNVYTPSQPAPQVNPAPALPSSHVATNPHNPYTNAPAAPAFPAMQPAPQSAPSNPYAQQQPPQPQQVPAAFQQQPPVAQLPQQVPTAQPPQQGTLPQGQHRVMGQ